MMNPTWPKRIDSGQVQVSSEEVRKILELAQASQELKVPGAGSRFRSNKRNHEPPQTVRK
jgi:hypothetical protein